MDVVHQDQHGLRRPDRHAPPAPPPTIPEGALNPDGPAHPDAIPPVVAPRPPDAGFPVHSPLPPLAVPHPQQHPLPPPPPGAYEVTDPQLFWMNNRPFLLHRSVGKGGFGEVYKAEMMLPPGMEVSRNPRTGAFILDEQGRVEVHLTTQRGPTPEDPAQPIEDEASSSGPTPAPSGVSIENIGAPDEEVVEALKLSGAVPASMNFVSVAPSSESADGKEVDAADGTLSVKDFRVDSSINSSPGTISSMSDR